MKESSRGSLYGALVLLIGGAIALMYFVGGGDTPRSNPQSVATEELTMIETLRGAMDAIPLIEIVDVMVNDNPAIFASMPIDGIVQVTFRTPSNDSLDTMKVQMQDIVCAYLGTGYTGFRLRIGGKNGADVTLITAALEPDILSQIDCENGGAINWETAASEWSVASGVQR